jgi:GH24 family phage-related lysozyme (muramidase)
MGQKLTESALKISDTGLKLIKAFEGYRPVDRELVTGQRVVGYGHRLYSDTSVMMSKREAEKTLRSDLQPFEDMINSEVHAPLSQSQFDALCSFAFNIGPKAFLTSDTLRALNNGRPLDAANSLDIWRKSEIAGKTYVVDALMRRRTAEKALFLRTDRNLPAGRVDLPPVRDTTISGLSTEDALPVYSATDTNGVVATAPHETFEPQYRRRDDGPAGALQLSERDVLEGDLSSDDEITDETLELPREDTRFSIDLAAVDGEADLNFKTTENVVQAFPQQTGTINLSSDLLADVSLSELDILEDEAAKVESQEIELPELETPDLPISDLPISDLDESDSDTDEDILPNSDTSDVPIDAPVRQSPIAAAATDIVARLDALIEDADARFDDRDDSWPESLITSELPEEADVQTSFNQVEEEAPFADFVEPERPEAREPREMPIKRAKIPQNTSAKNLRNSVMVIDELAQDDAFRVRNDSAGKYIQSRREVPPAPSPVPTSSELGLWIPVIIGFVLVGLAGGTMISGAEGLLGDWGPIIAFTGFVIGLSLIMMGVYAALRMNLRD